MAENKAGRPVHDQDPDLSNPANRHENSDVDIRAITKFGVALTLLCILTFALLIGVFRFYLSREFAAQPAKPESAAARRIPPEPRLQSTPIPDLRALRMAEDQILNGYAWIDPANGVVRIPVSQAIDLLVRRGLPSRPGMEPDTSGVSLPTDSGLGIKMQQWGGPLANEIKTVVPTPPAAEPRVPQPVVQEKKH